MAANRINLAIDDDVRDWIPWAASLAGETVTAYINGLVRKDMERATPEVATAFDAFMTARSTLREQGGE